VPGIQPIQLDPSTVLDIFLPPILFEAAFNAYWRELHRDRLLIAVLAILLVFITTTTVAGVALVLVSRHSGLGGDCAGLRAVGVGFGSAGRHIGADAGLALRYRGHHGESVMNDTASIPLYKTAIVGALTGAAHPGQAMRAWRCPIWAAWRWVSPSGSPELG
jgi:CPA1 family monovalent cation:H+ antiporter